ncbi:MAG: cysteine desulfurase [candidate division WOR-3 bacterium]|nr:cysteine desulfurase [candidate division WOR-3 bacterium]
MEVYLNNNATTKVDPEVLQAMLPYLQENYGNPSNLHSFGREAREALEQAREEVANFIKAKPEEIYFTSGGTESNNWAIKGILRANFNKGNHIIVSSIEHKSVLQPVEFLEKMRYIETTYLSVDQYGLVDPDELTRVISQNTILVSVMHCNNEVGTIQPIKELCDIAHKNGVYFHTDAVASAGQIPLDVNELGVDLLTISAHKIHGPKGIGALYIREGTKIERIIYGGEQEREMRAGTENVPGIVGFGKATVIAQTEFEKNTPQKIASLRDYFEEAITSQIPDVKVNGHPTLRSCSISNLSFANVNNRELIERLDKYGIKVSAGSACETSKNLTSHVLKAMKIESKYLDSQVRFGLSKYTTKEEIDYTIDILVKLVKSNES